MRLALSMIVKGDEGEKLDRCLASITKWVDKIYITVTTEDIDASKVAKKYNAEVSVVPGKFDRYASKMEIDWLKEFLGWEPIIKEGDRVFEFDEARNHSFDLVDEGFDYILWLDADDIFSGGQRLREVAEVAKEQGRDSVFFDYLYKVEVDDEGNITNVIIRHLRERLIKPGVFRWVAHIHETLVPQRPVNQMDSDMCEVIHLSNDKRMLGNMERNVRTLELSLYDTKGKDPRPIYYLGKTYYDMGGVEDNNEMYDRALKLFNVYLKGDKAVKGTNASGWSEERAQCWDYMAEIYRRWDDLNNSIVCSTNALLENPYFPESYLALAMSYIQKQDWDRAMHWVKIALNVPQPKSTLVGNPKEDALRAQEVVYHASINRNRIETALESAKALLELMPDNQEFQRRYDNALAIKQSVEDTRAFIKLAQRLESGGENEKLMALLSSAPKNIENNPFVMDLYKKVSPPREWGDDEIAIYCGPGWTNWSPLMLENPEGSFMGGSEEAVVYLSKELAELGWRVTVYADPGQDEGEYDGVTYLPHYKFNVKDSFNVLVSWRQPTLVDGNFKAKKTYIWMHDIANPLDFTPERLDKITKVIVLSPWHRTNIPEVPDNKVLISANGITL